MSQAFAIYKPSWVLIFVKQFIISILNLIDPLVCWLYVIQFFFVRVVKHVSVPVTKRPRKHKTESSFEIFRRKMAIDMRTQSKQKKAAIIKRSAKKGQDSIKRLNTTKSFA